MKRVLLLLTVAAIMAMTVALTASAAFASHAAQGGGRAFGQCQAEDAQDPYGMYFCIPQSHRGG